MALLFEPRLHLLGFGIVDTAMTDEYRGHDNSLESN
jgi:hypothetical protein